MHTGSGGGFGDPLERDPEQVAADVREGFVSANRAREVYGVVLTDDGRVDGAATAAVRASLRRPGIRG
jgi:N-methylhydantoinase B